MAIIMGILTKWNFCNLDFFLIPEHSGYKRKSEGIFILILRIFEFRLWNFS